MSQTMPTVLVYSGVPQDDVRIRSMIEAQYPGVPVMTASTVEEARERLPAAEILFAWTFPVELLPLSQNLRWFQVMGAGVERIAAGPRLPDQVKITNIKNVFGTSMSEYAFAYMLAHVQQVRQVLRAQSEHRWYRFEPDRLGGTTLGIIGLGSIGREVARTGSAMGMKVLGLRRGEGQVPGVEEVFTVRQIEQFLPQCDFLVCVAPHTGETAGLLTRERLKLLRRNCFLVNMGRGTIYREADLIEALREGWIAGAALDVFPEEPLPAESPLWSFENVFITAHVSGTNRPDEIVIPFLENLGRYLRGEPLQNEVDLDRGY